MRSDMIKMGIDRAPHRSLFPLFPPVQSQLLSQMLSCVPTSWRLAAPPAITRQPNSYTSPPSRKGPKKRLLTLITACFLTSSSMAFHMLSLALHHTFFYHSTRQRRYGRSSRATSQSKTTILIVQPIG